VKSTVGRTLLLLGIYVMLFLVGLLALELWSYQGGASISKAMTTVWNSEPWVVLLVSNLVTAVVAFLFGHWFGQKRPEQYARRPG